MAVFPVEQHSSLLIIYLVKCKEMIYSRSKEDTHENICSDRHWLL